MSTRTMTLCGLLLLAAAGPAYPQGSRAGHSGHDGHPHTPHRGPSAGDMEPSLVAAFAAEAREASARYRDRTAAIADGFRLLGPDFPAMGEHWVHPGRMVDGTLDVARPQALSYATIGGRPVLTGVIYARPLHADEAPPAFPFPGAPWHDHVGAIDEESVLLHHVASGAGAPQGMRLAMLHAWVWTQNPDGVFAADNWALPFLRLDIEVPSEISPAAARALSLVSGGEAYHMMLFRALAAPTAAEERRAAERIRRAARRVEQMLAATGADPPRFDATRLQRLELLWTTLWTELGAGVRPEAAARLDLLQSH